MIRGLRACAGSLTLKCEVTLLRATRAREQQAGITHAVRLYPSPLKKIFGGTIKVVAVFLVIGVVLGQGAAVIAQTTPGLICKAGTAVCLKGRMKSHDGMRGEDKQNTCGVGPHGETYIMQGGQCREVCRDGLTDYTLGLDMNCDRFAYRQCTDGAYLPVNQPCKDVLCADFDDCYQWASDHCPTGEDIEPSSFVFNGARSFSYTCSSPWKPWNNSEL